MPPETNETLSGMKSKVLVVDDEIENLRALERTLRNDFDVTSCETPEKALELARTQDFPVIVSDQRMPGMTGTELLALIGKEKPLTTRIILTAFTDTREMLDAINRAEIYRYVTKPWDNQELNSIVRQAVERHRLLAENQTLVRALEEKNRSLVSKEQELLNLNSSLERLVETRTAELRALNEKLNELAMTDPLTRVHNRRAFFTRFTDELERSKRYKHPFSVAMIDVDHFKSFNDMEGHLCGDEALKKIAQILTSKLRRTDFLCRYGGEEFLLMMPETKLSVGIDICERLRAAVEASVFQGQAENAYLTVSVGVSGFPEHGEVQDKLIQTADQALYQAKEFGRNRVVAAE
jgi:two-component system cell cycle response regulator